MKGTTMKDKIKTNKTVGIPTNGVAGLALLFVSISIAYSNYVVFFGTNDLISKVMLAPSSAFVIIFLVYKAVK